MFYIYFIQENLKILSLGRNCIKSLAGLVNNLLEVSENYDQKKFSYQKNYAL